MTTIAAPIDVEDGIYPNVPDAEYRKWPRMNPSCLDWGVETMEHLKAAWDGELKLKTKPLAFGIAGHVRLLEPHLYKDRYAVSGQCEAKIGKKQEDQCSKWGKQRENGHWYCGLHSTDGAGDAIEDLKPDEADTIEKCSARVKRHPAISLLRQNGGCEVSIAWTDKRTGIKCKTRVDKWIPECQLPGDTGVFPTILDLKYLAFCDDRSISAGIEEYGYARRAGMTIDGIEALTELRPDYILVCIQKTPPYGVAVRQLDEESIKFGKWEYRNILANWKNCLKTGVFPGYGNDIQEIGLPEWKRKELKGMVPDDYD